MESTGVYWLPIYERIEAKCPDRQSLLVVNAYEIKNIQSHERWRGKTGSERFPDF